MGNINKTDDYTISEVFDFVTGECIKTENIFKNYEAYSADENLIKKAELRSELEDARKGYKQPIYGCWYCHSLVVLRAINFNKRKQHFKAVHSENCIVKSLKSLSHEQILRIKFNGLQEGRDHIELKNKIADLLLLNKRNKHQVDKIIVDKRRCLTTDDNSKEWRKPDIFATLQLKEKNYNLAIELQLATTFIEVVKERQHFYRRDNSYILWVFRDFSTNINELKMMYIDVFVANSKNAFVINQETIIESEKRGDFVLSCYYRKYKRVGMEISSEWENSLITLSELTYSDDFRAFYHDADGEYTALQVEKEEYEKQQTILQNARSDLSKIQLSIPKSTSKMSDFSQRSFIDQLQIDDGAENLIVEQIVGRIKDIYRNGSENGYLSHLVDKEINNFSENSIQKLNEKLRFASSNKDFIKKLIFDDIDESHKDFFRLVFYSEIIKLDLDLANNEITAFEKIISDAQLYQIPEIIANFYRNNYIIKSSDRAFLEQKFPCQDIKNEYFHKYFLINLMSKLNSYNLVCMLDKNMHCQLIIWALLSVKYDQFIYWHHQNFRQDANLIFDKYPEFGDVYINCLNYYDKLDLLFKEDKSGNFKKNFNYFQSHKPEQDFEHSEILKFVIPEIFN